MKAGRVKGVSDQFIFALQNSHYFVESRRFRGPIMHASLIGIDHTFCSQLSVFTLLTAVVNRASWAHHGCQPVGARRRVFIFPRGRNAHTPSFLFHKKYLQVGARRRVLPFSTWATMPTPPVFYFIKNICRHIA